MAIKVTTIDNTDGHFEDDEWRHRCLRAWHPYRVVSPGSTQYAWSPDGIGCYWYDTLDELIEQHL